MTDPQDDIKAMRSEADAYLAAIVSSSDDAIISKDLNGIVTFWNDAAERLFGYSSDEAVGKSLMALIIPPERAEEELQIIARLRRGEKIDHFETVRRTKSGQQLEVSITISPIRDKNGKIIGASKVARDITACRALERQLHDTARSLAEKDRTKDEFLAMLAHELRNPLAPLSNALHILSASAATPPIREEALAMAKCQVALMVRLLDDLLDVSRITHGKINIRVDRVDLCKVLKHAIETARPALRAQRHHFQTHVPECPLWIKGDSERLVQLFGNLINNAAKYTLEGGTITLDASHEGGNVVVRISDTGIGIEPDKLPLVFDLFMQVDSSIERIQGGMGIGLTLVKRIAELHGGTVSVESPGKNKGTIFTVRLPLVEYAAQAAPSLSVAAPAASADPCRILVVDDNTASAKTLGWTLEMLGHDVMLASNGHEALKLARDYKPDVALLDIGMPDINGYELCRLMRQEEGLQNVIYIAQTGWGQEQHLQKARESGFDHHLTKPISLEALQRQLEGVCKKVAA